MEVAHSSFAVIYPLFTCNGMAVALPQNLRDSRTKVFRKALSSFLHGLHGAILFFPFILFVVLVQGPIYLYRGILTKIVAPLCHPRIGKAVTSSIQFQATEFVNTKADKGAKYSIVTSLIFSGELPLEQVQHLILEGWLQAREENGEVRYPEFRQYVEHWWGFMFWKEDPHFDVNNHLVSHKLGETVTAEDSARFHDTLVEQLLNTPYPRKRSPWEVHLIHNFKCTPSSDGGDAKEDVIATLIVVRLHHAMADGSSLTYALVEGLLGNTMTTAYDGAPVVLKTKKRHPFSKVVDLLFLLPHLLRDFGFVMHLFWCPQSPWKGHKRGIISTDEEYGGASDQNPLQRQIYCRAPLIPINTIKFIKNKFRVSFSSVLLSCVGAALAKNFKEASPVINRDSLRLYIGLPAGGHRNKLRNNILGAVLSVDTTPDASPTTRLLASDQVFQKTKQSLLPCVIYYICNLMSGSLVHPFARFVSNRDFIPVGVSNFPGPSTTVGLQRGQSSSKCLSCDVTVAAYADLSFLILSYNGFIRIAVTADNRALNRPQVETILEHFYEEVQNLHQLAAQLH